MSAMIVKHHDKGVCSSSDAKSHVIESRRSTVYSEYSLAQAQLTRTPSLLRSPQGDPQTAVRCAASSTS